MSSNKPSYLFQLLKLIDNHFDLGDIQNVCLYLAIDYENLSGETKLEKVRALLLYLARRNNLESLLEVLRNERPKVSWPSLPKDIDLEREVMMMEDANRYSPYDSIGERGVRAERNVLGNIITGDNNTIINEIVNPGYERSIPHSKFTPPFLDIVNPVFIGRENELSELTNKIAEESPIVLWGAAGIGKTTLAVELANRVKHLFPGGQVWLDCRINSSFDTLLNNLGIYLGLRIENLDTSAKEITLHQYLASLEKRFLLIWDSVEAVWFNDLGNSNQQLNQFLYKIPSNCQLILTTRKDLEQPGWLTFELHPLRDDEMKDLFWKLVKQSGINEDFQSELTTIGSILNWLNGHPLALMLTVPLIKKRGVIRVWNILRQRPLKGIVAALNASYEGLTPQQQELYKALSVFTIPFEWEAAAAIMPEADYEDELLDGLAQGSLIHFNGVWYLYHNLTRQDAQERLMADGTEVLRRTYSLAAAYLQEISYRRARMPEEGLVEVDLWEKAEEWDRFSRRCAEALVGSMDRLGYWSDIQNRLQKALGVTQTILQDVALEAWILNDLGVIARKFNRHDDAITLLNRSCDLYLSVENETGLAHAYSNLGNVYNDKGQWGQALLKIEHARKIWEETQDIRLLCMTYTKLAGIYRGKGNKELAVDYYEKALNLAENDSDERAYALAHYALIYLESDQTDRAIDMLSEATIIAEKTKNIYQLSGIYHNLGKAYGDKGNSRQALTFFIKSAESAIQLGDLLHLSLAYSQMSSIYIQTNEWEKALDFTKRSLNISKFIGDDKNLTERLSNMGQIYAEMGDFKQAIELFESIVEMQLDNQINLGIVYHNLGTAYKSLGDYDKAFRQYKKSLEEKKLIGDNESLAKTYNSFGELLRQRGDLIQASENHLKALKIYRKLEHKQGMIESFTFLGGVHLIQGNFDQALSYFQKDLEISTDIKDRFGIAQTLQNIGNANAQKGELNEAVKCFNQAINIFEELGNNQSLALALSHLASTYLKFGKKVEAKPLLARAFFISKDDQFSIAQLAATKLVEACGSVELANSYINQFP